MDIPENYKVNIGISDCSIFICPPWAIYRFISGARVNVDIRKKVFLLIWTIIQWSVLVDAGSNVIFSILIANLSVAMFFLANIFFTISDEDHSAEELQRIRNIAVILVATTAVFILMYKIPVAIGFVISKLSWNYTTHYSTTDRYVNIILAISWFIFAIVTRYKLFGLLPKKTWMSSENLISLTDRKVCSVVFIYLMLIILLLRF